MPANLNALIRYKTIDNCLQNNAVQWTIERLQEECKEACGEFRGLYKTISERTIRDDIRVMRSEILGFNAPIVCKNGHYRYTDQKYSIFDVPLKTKRVLKKTKSFLLENKKALNCSDVDDIILELDRLTLDSPVIDFDDQMGDLKSDQMPQFVIQVNPAKSKDIEKKDQSVSNEKRPIFNWGKILQLLG